MMTKRPFLAEALSAVGLVVAPFVLPHLGFSPTTINRILIWGLFGIGFDILFGYTGLLSFGQSAFYGTRRHVRRLSADGAAISPMSWSSIVARRDRSRASSAIWSA